jgi:hypothetical protein
MNKDKEEIEKSVLAELQEALESQYAENSIKEVVEINEEDQTITIKFSYQIVEEDNYIGLAQY